MCCRRGGNQHDSRIQQIVKGMILHAKKEKKERKKSNNNSELEIHLQPIGDKISFDNKK